MKHVKPVTRTIPARAQFEPILQFIALLQAILGLAESWQEFKGEEQQ